MLRTLIVSGSRKLVALPRRYSGIRHLIPSSVAQWYKVGRARLSRAQVRYLPLKARSSFTNVYHCTFQKIGSVWIRSVLTDPVTYQYSGLSHYAYQHELPGTVDTRLFRERTVEVLAPEHTVVSPLYLSYANYLAMPKPESHRTFFVMRDPRELTVSWYFSTLQTHYLIPGSRMAERRSSLQSMSQEDGLISAVEHMAERGIYSEMPVWLEAAQKDPLLMIVRYEDLVSRDGYTHFRKLFDHLDIRIPDAELRDLITAYSFKRLSGRKQGEENEKSHLRSGGSETWRKYFTPAVLERFEQLSENVIERTGYPS